MSFFSIHSTSPTIEYHYRNILLSQEDRLFEDTNKGSSHVTAQRTRIYEDDKNIRVNKYQAHKHNKRLCLERKIFKRVDDDSHLYFELHSHINHPLHEVYIWILILSFLLPTFTSTFSHVNHLNCSHDYLASKTKPTLCGNRKDNWCYFCPNFPSILKRKEARLTTSSCLQNMRRPNGSKRLESYSKQLLLVRPIPQTLLTSTSMNFKLG